MFANILVGTDGSDAAMRAAETGREIAMNMNASVTIVHAAYIPPSYLDDLRPELQDAIRDDGKRILKMTINVFESSNVKVETTLLFNEKAEDGILRLIEERGYDLVILGSRGLDATARKALGSTSMRVMEGTNIPVLIVH
jgi:nucleotide-binding universal stress UspA family protein